MASVSLAVRAGLWHSDHSSARYWRSALEFRIWRLSPSWKARAFTNGSYSRCSYELLLATPSASEAAAPTKPSLPNRSSGKSPAGPSVLR